MRHSRARTTTTVAQEKECELHYKRSNALEAMFECLDSRDLLKLMRLASCLLTNKEEKEA